MAFSMPPSLPSNSRAVIPAPVQPSVKVLPWLLAGIFLRAWVFLQKPFWHGL